MNNNNIKKTAFYDYHKKLNGNIVNFEGVYLPIFYSSIQEEHKAVRMNIGIFDVSHMGNIIMSFDNRNKAVDFFNYLLPNDFSNIFPGKCIYSTMLNHEGGVIDDIIVMSLSDTEYHIIVNASNITKDYDWIKDNINDREIIIENKSDFFSIIALQGPKAYLILQKELGFPIKDLKSFRVIQTSYKENNLYISRTGYTGEDGYELIINKEISVSLFDDIIKNGKKYNLIPCGLGARDTLRLEASLPLYGHELDDKHSPLQTMMSWSVKLSKKEDFIGKTAIQDDSLNRFKDKLVGFEVIGKAIPRNNMQILNNNENIIGYVTSGSYSPTLQKNIGIAYIKPEYINESELKIQIRNRIEKIKIMDLPFYRRKN